MPPLQAAEGEVQQGMSEPFDIQSYMTQGVERVVGDIMKAAAYYAKREHRWKRF